MISTNTSFSFIHHSTKVRLICVIVGWLIQCVVFGQGIAPLQLTTQFQPPYSSNINDYITAGSEKLRLIVLQRDLTQANYRFYLRMELSVNGNVLFRTPAGWVPNELINILPGTPTILDGTQLQTYFDANNLEFVGYSREQYIRTGNLPEGFTTICFTAYDAGRPEVSVSHPACGMYYLTLSDPPMLAMPTCGSDVLARTPQQVVFNWIAMGMGKISATPTQYEFSLYENRDGRNPNEVVESLRPIYTQQTSATMMVYGMTEPMLTEGMQYVWRVQAIDDLGKAAFKNNGFSTPCTFTYKSADQYNWQEAPAIKLRADVLNHERVKLVYNWDKALPYDEYFVEFHKPGKENAWFSVTRSDTVYHLVNLEEDMQYEARVTGIKGVNKGKTSETVRFRTTKKKVANCKETPSVLATYNGRPYTSAMKNDLIKFGDFELTINQLQKLPEPGWYRGTGTVKVDFMAGMLFKVKFENLQIDDRLEGTAGELVFMREGMEAWKEQVKSVGEVVKELVKNVQQLLKHYTGTESDKKEIAAAQKQVNEQYELLFNSPYLAQPTKDSLKQMQTKARESWDALAKGRKCTETEKVVENKSKGPYIYNDYLGDEYSCYTNQVEQELEEIESGVNTIASEKAEGLDCYCNQSPTIADYLLKLNPFSGESPCVFVQKALKRIKESVGDQEFSFITSRETEANQLISETECLSIMGEEIKKTRIIYFTEQLQQMGKSSYSFHFNKNDLQDYAYKGDAKKQRGLIHYNKKGISDFMILIDEEDDAKFEKQREVLKKYLGIGGGGKEVENKKIKEDDEFGEISDLPALIAPSNGSDNFRGGTFGCTRTMSYPVKQNKRRFCIRCNSCMPNIKNSIITRRFHGGVDISMPFGTEIKTITSGVITFIINDQDKSGLGSFAIVETNIEGKKIKYIYGHLDGKSFDMNLNGKKIEKGKIFAKTGNTGNIATIEKITLKQQHCHLQIKVNDEIENPKNYISKKLLKLISQYEIIE